MKRERLEQYAELIIRKGANVQKGQPVRLLLQAEHYELARLLADSAYAAGASRVDTIFSDQGLEKLAFLREEEAVLAKVHNWQKARLEEQVEELPAQIYIDSEDPDGLAGVDSTKLQNVATARRKESKAFRDRMENKYQWCIAAAASPAWARKVFPELTEAEAVEKLWEAILASARVEVGKDALAAWDRHNENFAARSRWLNEQQNENFAARSRWLNEQQFDHLHYRSPQGTDFRVWLNADVLWAGGDEKLLGGEARFGHELRFNPNMPTEEIFTSPIAGRAEGRVLSSLPLSYQGQVIKDFELNFENGSVTAWKAREGEELLGRLIQMDEGSRRLGECALVPVTSPVYRSGLLFYNTLFDENAACHLAIGAGFTNLYKNYERYSKQELIEKGINDSLTHVDFMIGSPDLDIDGIRRDGQRIPIFRKGDWAFDI